MIKEITEYYSNKSCYVNEVVYNDINSNDVLRSKWLRRFRGIETRLSDAVYLPSGFRNNFMSKGRKRLLNAEKFIESAKGKCYFRTGGLVYFILLDGKFGHSSDIQKLLRFRETLMKNPKMNE